MSLPFKFHVLHPTARKAEECSIVGGQEEEESGFVEQMADSGVPASWASGHDKESLEV